MADKLTRFDYVAPLDGEPAWCVEVTQSAPDPFDANAIHTRTVGPLTPAQAKEQFGFDLADVVEGINVTALTECERLRAALIEEREVHVETQHLARAEHDRLEAEIAALRTAKHRKKQETK